MRNLPDRRGFWKWFFLSLITFNTALVSENGETYPHNYQSTETQYDESEPFVGLHDGSDTIETCKRYRDVKEYDDKRCHPAIAGFVSKGGVYDENILRSDGHYIGKPYGKSL